VLNALVVCEQERLQCMSETIPANSRILWAVRQWITSQQIVM